MKNDKTKNIMIGILVGIIVVLVVVIGFAYNNKEADTSYNCNNNDIVEYTYEDIKGLYSYTSDKMTDDVGTDFQATYKLCLYENGTFNYRMSTLGSFGYMGNYVIVDNTIILNYLFSTNSGAGIDVTTGSKTITITDKDTLVDDNQSISMVNMTSVTLEKAISTEENEFLHGNDFVDILNNYEITNEAND